MKPKIKIISPDKHTPPNDYPYWGVNEHNDLFLITEPGKGISVEHWTTIQSISEHVIARLPVGTKVELTIQ